MFLELTKLYPHFSTGSWDYWNLTSSQDKASIRPSILSNWPVHRERVHFNLFLAHADTAQKESSTRRTALSSKQNSCIHDMAGRRALMRNRLSTDSAYNESERAASATDKQHASAFIRSNSPVIQKRSVSMTMCTKCKGTRVQRHKHSKAVMSSSTS